MGAFVSRNKGCYPGQEVFEKTFSRNSPAKKLCKVEWIAPVELSPIHYEENAVGEITSLSNSRIMSLCVIRKNAAIENTILKTEAGIEGKVTYVFDLPNV
jgi:folate-binding Fe-S cluster repair protein YgfZ